MSAPPEPSKFALPALLGVSTAAHITFALVLQLIPQSTSSAADYPGPTFMELAPEPEEDPDPVVVEEPEPAPEIPEPEPEIPRVRQRRPRPQPVEPPPPQEEPPPPEPEEEPPPALETVVDMTSGQTLEADGPSSFSVRASGGGDGDLQVNTGGVATGRRRDGVAGGAIGGTGTGPARPVPAVDRSQRARPPARRQRRLLERLHERYLRANNIRPANTPGRAVVSVSLNADGSVRNVQVVSESAPGMGYGQSCRRAILEAGDWGPELGPDGQPRARRIPRYPCTFRRRR